MMLREIFLGIFANQLDKKLTAFLSRRSVELSRAAFLDSLDAFELEFERLNDGTIVSDGVFYSRLKLENIVPHIFEYFFDPSCQTQGELDFIQGKISQLTTSISCSRCRSLSTPDERIISDFINEISRRTKAFLFEKAPEELLPLLYGISQTRLEARSQSAVEIELIEGLSGKIDNVSKDINQYALEMSEVSQKVNSLAAIQAKLMQPRPVVSNFAFDSHEELLLIGLQEYTFQITCIEEMQKNHRFYEAIEKYNEIRDGILYKATDKAVKISDEVIHKIDINSALCFGNLRQFPKAWALLDRIEKSGGHKNKQFHFVSASLIVMQNDVSRFYEGMEHINKALEIDNTYYKAILMKSVFQALLNLYSFDEILQMLNGSLVMTKAIDADNDLKAEYYSNLGLLCIHFGKYSDALQNFELSNSIREDISNKINVALTYYRWALCSNLPSERVLKPIADYKKLNEAARIIEELFNSNPIDKNPILKEIIPVYVSACHFLHRFDDILNIGSVVNLNELDDETQRNITISKIILQKDADKDICKLDGQDALGSEIHELISKDDYRTAIAILETTEKKSPSLLCDKTFTQLAECYLALGLTTSYKSLRERLEQRDYQLTYKNLFDARYHEQIGEIDKVSAICTSFATQSNDESELIYTINFFRANGNNELLSKLYLRIVGLLQQNEMPRLFQPEAFFKQMVSDLVSIDFNFTCAVIKSISPTLFGEKPYRETAIKLAMVQFDCYTAIQLLEESIRENANLNDYMHLILNLKNCCRFEDALAVAKVVEEKYLKSNPDIATDLFELLSELYLFRIDYDNSYSYIKKARELHIKDPYHMIHQLYMSRATRCNHVDDGLRDSLEFKHLHPNITDWLQEIEAFREAPDGTMQQTDQMRSIFEDRWKRFTSLIDFYRERVISLLQLSALLPSSITDIINFSKAYHFRMRVFSGNNEVLTEEISRLIAAKAVMIDAFSLSFLAYYNALSLLNGFEKVHITCSSIVAIQTDYIETGAHYLHKALQYIGQNLNIIVEPNLYHSYNLFSDDSEESFLYPQNVHDTLNAAKTNSIPYIYCDDSLGKFLQSQKSLGASVVALISFYKKADPSFASKLIYELLNDNIEFVNFNADDMFFAIQNLTSQNYVDSLKPFLKVNSASDVISFAHVYYDFLLKLKEYRSEMFEIVLNAIFEYADVCYHRSSYHLDSWLEFSSINDSVIVKQLMTFSMATLTLIKRVIGLDDFKKIASSGIIKYIPSSMIEKITSLT